MCRRTEVAVDVNSQVANGVDWLNKSAGYRKRTAGTLRGRAPHHFSFISVEFETCELTSEL